MNCVKLARLNICLSGEAESSILPTRGFRQGDPFSPYLFILVAEVLSLMISKSHMVGMIKGVKLSLGSPIHTHTFFVNDALLYMNASRETCTNLACILNVYSKASGQVINLDKSSLFSLIIPLEKLRRWWVLFSVFQQLKIWGSIWIFQVFGGRRRRRL